MVADRCLPARIGDTDGVTEIVPWLLRLVRIGLLVVLFFLLLSTVIALGGTGTGVFEKGVMVVVFVGLLTLAAPVHRIGQDR